MILGVDASNIRAGGGVTHLVELLKAADPMSHGFKKVIVWGNEKTLEKIHEKTWLYKLHDPMLDRILPIRIYWQRFRLKALARDAGCDVLLIPGGSDSSGFKPAVAMSRNLLPFEWRESRRYGLSWMTLKLQLLRITQTRTFRRASAVIFITEHAREVVLRVTGTLKGRTTTIYHGIDTRFFTSPRPQRAAEAFTQSDPCRILYVSIVDVYKHQWHVAEAVACLRAAGFHVVLDLVGPPAYGMAKLKDVLKRVDPEGEFITYRGAVPHAQLHEHYKAADIGVFASSCEAFGQILTEAMSAGLPMACSNRSAMRELLADAGVYFDPESPDDIAQAIQCLMQSPDLRMQKAQAAFTRASNFSWERCSRETFQFLAEVGGQHSPNSENKN